MHRKLEAADRRWATRAAQLVSDSVQNNRRVRRRKRAGQRLGEGRVFCCHVCHRYPTGHKRVALAYNRYIPSVLGNVGLGSLDGTL